MSRSFLVFVLFTIIGFANTVEGKNVYEEWKAPRSSFQNFMDRIPGNKSDQNYLSRYELSICNEREELYVLVSNQRFKVPCNLFIDAYIRTKDHKPETIGTKSNPIPSLGFTTKLNSDPNVSLTLTPRVGPIGPYPPDRREITGRLLSDLEVCKHSNGLFECKHPDKPRKATFYLSDNPNHKNFAGERLHYTCNRKSNSCSLGDKTKASKVELQIKFEPRSKPKQTEIVKWFSKSQKYINDWTN